MSPSASAVYEKAPEMFCDLRNFTRLSTSLRGDWLFIFGWTFPLILTCFFPIVFTHQTFTYAIVSWSGQFYFLNMYLYNFVDIDWLLIQEQFEAFQSQPVMVWWRPFCEGLRELLNGTPAPSFWICPWPTENLVPLRSPARNSGLFKPDWVFLAVHIICSEKLCLFGNPLKSKPPIHLQFAISFPWGL